MLRREPLMFQGLRTAAYQVKDLDKAKAWYSNILGLQPYFDQPFYVGFNVGGFELGLVPAEDAKPNRAPAGIAYWGVADAQTAYKRLVELGASGFEPIQGLREGNQIGGVGGPFC